MDEAIRRKILTLLDQHRIMTIATQRPDGWPQATTVGYANEGLTLYFLCGPEIMGLSMAARAQVVVDPDEAQKALRLLLLRYPEQHSVPLPMPTPADVRIFRVTPTVVSVLDYTRGFGHADLVTC